MDSPINWSPGVTLDAIEKQVILMAFRFYRGNKTATANALGIAVRTLDNKLDKYELDGKVEKERAENERTARADFLARSRGGHAAITGTPGQPAPAGTEIHSAHTGVHLEPAQEVAKEPAVSVPKQEKVQVVLPKQAAAHGADRRR